MFNSHFSILFYKCENDILIMIIILTDLCIVQKGSLRTRVKLWILDSTWTFG